MVVWMNNSEYWKKRFELLEDAQNKVSEKYVEVLKEEYDKALANIERNITTWYTRIANNNEVTYVEAKQLLDKKELKEFKWTVEEYIKRGKENDINQKWIKELENASARVHIEKLEAIKIQIKNELERLSTKQEKGTTELLKKQYEDSYYKSAYEIQNGLREYTAINPVDMNKLSKVISKPWTTDNKTFSSRIWEHKEQLLKNLQRDLIQATIRGDDLKNVIDKISKDFNVSKGKAVRLVMTESAFFSSVGQKECFNNLNVGRFEIVATLDSHTSEICQEMDGKVFNMKDYEAGVTAPPFHCNCRSCTAPYFDDEFTIGEQRAARDENGNTVYVDSKMKYKEWKEKYVDNNQNNWYNKLGNSDKNGIGGSGKGQFIEKIKEIQIKDKLQEYEEDIRNMPIEYAMLIDEKGDVYAYIGDKTNLNITDRKLDNAIITHNHPEIGAFGKDDYVLLYDNPKIKQLRAIDKNYNYKLELLKPLDITYNEIYRLSGEIMRETLEEEQHCVMIKLKELGYIEYERTRKK